MIEGQPFLEDHMAHQETVGLAWCNGIQVEGKGFLPDALRLIYLSGRSSSPSPADAWLRERSSGVINSLCSDGS